MIRILHICSSLGYGGTAVQLDRLFGGIDKSKFKFDFIVHGNNTGATETTLKAQGCEVYHVAPKKESLLSCGRG